MASLLVDIEPFLVLTLGLRYPLHGYLHTFLLASLFGALIGLVMFLVDPRLHKLFRTIHLVSYSKDIGSFMIAGVLGGLIHIILDAPMYAEMNPFFPLYGNPLYNPSYCIYITFFCILTGSVGIFHYAFTVYLIKARKHTIL